MGCENGEDAGMQEKKETLIYSLFVEGEPKAQPRPRRGRYGNFYNPGTADVWKETVQAAFLTGRKPVIQAPVKLTVHFFFHRSMPRDKEILPHTGKPDIDNLIKPVMDALTAIGIWKDDCLVSSGETKKYWTAGKSGARITVETDE
jgi:Holliday junction resolvase RusA-like endonuclease